METVSLEITSTQNQLDTKLKNENVKKLMLPLRKNDEKYRKPIQQSLLV